MRFLSEKTNVPVPRVIGHTLPGNDKHVFGFAFITMEHVPGEPLTFVWDKLDDGAKGIIYDQLAVITLELTSRPFLKIGALTLKDDDGDDEAGKHWILGNSRPSHLTLLLFYMTEFESTCNRLTGMRFPLFWIISNTIIDDS